MDLKALRQRAADLNAEITKAKKDRAALGSASVAEKRGLSDDERAKFVAAGAQIEALEAQLADNALLLTAAEAANEAERSYRGAMPAQPETPRIEVIADEQDKKAKEPGHFGRQLHAVRKFALEGAHGLTPAERDLLKPMQATVASGANTDVPSEGGFLVGQQRSGTILQRSYSQGQILGRVQRQPIGAGFNGITLPAVDETSRANGSRFGGIASGWLGQANTPTSGKPKFRQMDLKLKKVAALVYATDELLVDAVGFESFVSRILPLELTFRAEDSIVNGVGGYQPLGLLNSGAVISIARNTTSRVLYDDVRGMWNRMYAPSRSNAVWLIDQSVESELEQMTYPIGTAGVLAPCYRPAGYSQGQLDATLYGRPVIVTEYGANMGTVGDILLVDLSEYVLIDKGSVEQAVSLHVQFLTDEAVYRFIYRVDGQLTWNSALTPKSAGSTLSCALSLAT